MISKEAERTHEFKMIYLCFYVKSLNQSASFKEKDRVRETVSHFSQKCQDQSGEAKVFQLLYIHSVYPFGEQPSENA